MVTPYFFGYLQLVYTLPPNTKVGNESENEEEIGKSEVSGERMTMVGRIEVAETCGPLFPHHIADSDPTDQRPDLRFG